ncbi:CpsD/CapB family tyrosine-protein kinase [Niallia oryzisoli]|uniref:CpsD/CapB family tyrosine-protein kinase n=1 Tax=Niallia oryzisoli TaxID=1737571 RepID=UPI003735021C
MGRNKKAKGNDVKRSLITQQDPKSHISEQYRTIRTNIQFASVDKELTTIVVTSSGPAEGKSTTVANLAVVFAQQGKQVLLIDSDLRKPTVHYTFQVSNIKGLTTVLTKQSTLEEVIQPSMQENLSLVTSGPIPPNPAELLSSKAMEELIKEASTTYDMVLFDSPPLLAVTDGQILASKCDGTLLIVSSGKTEIEQAIKAKDLLNSVNSHLLGVILNNKKLKNPHYYSYYGE